MTRSNNITTNYLKKVIDENASGEDTVKLLKFLVWENWDMSLVVLNELINQVCTYVHSILTLLSVFVCTM